MSAFFSSLGSDLRDRRFLPILVLLGVALAAAVAYAVLGGGSSAKPTPAPISASTGVTGSSAQLTIVKAPETTSKQAVAETTSGAPHPSGAPHDPFKPLPGAKESTSSSSKSSSASGSSGSSSSAGKSSGSSSSGSSSSSSSGSSSSSSSSGSGGATPPSKPSAPAKPKPVVHYRVTVQFGVVPAVAEGAPPQPAQLKTFPELGQGEALPGKSDPQLVYQGVQSGDTAMFGLSGEAILHGAATCKPSPTECQAIALKAGQSETLEVVGPTGQAVTYELKVVSIAKDSGGASTARAHAASSRGGRKHRHRH